MFMCNVVKNIVALEICCEIAEISIPFDFSRNFSFSDVKMSIRRKGLRNEQSGN